MKELIFSGHQPNILPYMGFFYKMFKSDVFVLDDDVQYSRTGLHNSNYIRVNNQKHKFTIPVKYEFGDPINNVRISYDKDWISPLMKTVEMNYKKAAQFDIGCTFLEKHLSNKPELLVELTIPIIKDAASYFGLSTDIKIASVDVPTTLKKNERNLYQCKKLGCSIYYSGVGGREYNDEEMYLRNGIEVKYSDYSPTSYKQVGYGFMENLSVIDYIFNQGFVLPKEWVK